MPTPKPRRARVSDGYRTAAPPGNSGLVGIPGINEAVGWKDPAFRHICVVALEMRGAGVELTAETMNAVIKMGRARYAEGKTPEGRPRGEPTTPYPTREQMAAVGVVYYIRRGEFVKIGTTIRLKDRMHALAPDEVLAVEPGSYQLERRMHRRFAHLRAPFMREYFRMDPELLTHIAKVIEQHGPPPEGLLTFGEPQDKR